MRKLKDFVWLILNRLGIGAHVMLHLDSALKEDGWFRSYRERQSVDRTGSPLPWYTYSFIEFLKPRLKPEFTVFEYGSGNSTRWYAGHVSSVTAVEHHEAWYRSVASLLPSNAAVLHRERGEKYIQAVGETGRKYQIIVVDGRDRVKCTLYAVNFLTSDGILILDNSERKWYQPAKDELARMGFRKIDFSGILPIVSHKSCSTVFYRDGNCLGI